MAGTGPHLLRFRITRFRPKPSRTRLHPCAVGSATGTGWAWRATGPGVRSACSGAGRRIAGGVGQEVWAGFFAAPSAAAVSTGARSSSSAGAGTALAQLREERLIVTTPGWGSFVRERD